MKKTLTLLSLLPILACSSDEEQQQYPLTTNGSNSLEYTYNGTRISSFDCDLKEMSADVSLNQQTIVFKLGKDEQYSEIHFYSDTKLVEGHTYSIKGKYNSNIRATNEFYGPSTQYLNSTTNNEVGGTITIAKFDLKNGIIAATFSFDTVDSKGNIYTIRDGWFDLKFLR